MSLPPLLINAAYNTFMNVCIQLPLRLPQFSVSNSSKLAIPCWVRVGTEQEPLQRVLPHQKTEPHRTRGFLAGSKFSQTKNIGSN